MNMHDIGLYETLSDWGCYLCPKAPMTRKITEQHKNRTWKLWTLHVLDEHCSW